MNPELLVHYQELLDIIAPLGPNDWNAFRLEGDVDESGLGISLEFLSSTGAKTECSVPFEVFDIMESIRVSAGPDLAWSQWNFECDRNGKYNINVTYPAG